MNSMRTITACLLLAASLGASAQSFPSKPIRIVVPFAPGGLGDISTRTVSDRLGARLGQSVFVDNRPGAGGNIGTAQVAKSAPDGYTLLLGFAGTLVVNPHVYSTLGFDTLRDFAPVTKLADSAVIIVAHPSLPAKDLRELIALAKSKPGSLSYGSAGTGSTSHLACELLAQRAGVSLIHVPYKGGGQSINDVLGGQIPLLCTTLASSQQFLKAGRLKGLAVSSAARSPEVPGVPTFVESGFPGLVVDSWVGILAPAKTPRAIVDRLHKEITAVLQMPEVRERYAALSIEPVGNSPDEYAEQIRADLARWEPVVKKVKLRVE